MTDAEMVAAIKRWQDRIDMTANHRYRVRGDDGKWSYVPGTTTVCKQLGGQALLDWAARMAYEHQDPLAHNKIRDDAGDKGTSLHRLIERECHILMGQPVEPMPPATDDELQALARWKKWARDAEFRPLMTEFRVYNPLLVYAGTADVLGYVRPLVDGKRGASLLVLGDWKGGKLRDSAHMQSVAYRAAIGAMSGVTPEGYLVRVPRDGDSIVEMPAAPCFDLALKAFEGLLHAYHWQKEMRRHAAA